MITAERIMGIMFEDPDCNGECDGCGNEAELIEMPNSDDGLYFCRRCLLCDDDRGRRWRLRIMEWWEERKGAT